MEEQQRRTDLPFSETLQNALVGHMAVSRELVVRLRPHVRPGWFLDPYNEKWVAALLEFHEKYKRHPTLTELKDHPSIVSEDPRVKQKLYGQIDRCLYLMPQYGQDVICGGLTRWLQVQALGGVMERGATLWNARKPEEAHAVFKEGIRKWDDCDLLVDPEESFTGFDQEMNERQREYDDALTFGNSNFDRLLTPKAKKGSLLLGDTTILLAPTNIGKTTTMFTVARHNILRQKPTLIITHEGQRLDLKEKLWCSLLGVTPAVLMEMKNDPVGRRRMEAMLAWIQRYLTFVPLNKPGLTVEEVEAVIRQKNEERKSRDPEGKGYALVIDDYPAKLTCLGARNGKMSRREKDQYVYNYFVQMALDLNFHALLAIQCNREGSRVNKGQKEYSRLLEMEDVMESFETMAVATNVISINRDPLAQARQRVTYYICKSRSGETGIAVVCRSDFQHYVTHSDDLGCTWYRGTSTLTEQLDGLLQIYENKQIDPKHVGF